jgi:hypothetical protein
MDETLDSELAVESLPYVRDILDQAGSMMSSGVSGETVLITVVAVPLMLKGLDLVRPYLQVHAEDKRATVHVAHMEQLAELRAKYGPEVFADATSAMDAGAGMAMPPMPKPKK